MTAEARRTRSATATALVLVRTPAGAFAVPVAATRAVVRAHGLRPLPAPAPQVAGLLDHGGRSLPVLAPFGAAGAHVLVLEAGDLRFGLLVDEVTGVVRVAEEDVGPAPAGQAEPLVAGVVRRGGADALVLDPHALRRRLA